MCLVNAKIVLLVKFQTVMVPPAWLAKLMKLLMLVNAKSALILVKFRILTKLAAYNVQQLKLQFMAIARIVHLA